MKESIIQIIKFQKDFIKDYKTSYNLLNINSFLWRVGSFFVHVRSVRTENYYKKKLFRSIYIIEELCLIIGFGFLMEKIMIF